MNRSERNSGIIASRLAGDSFQAIGRRYGVSGTTARKIFFDYEFSKRPRSRFEGVVGESIIWTLSRFYGVPANEIVGKHIIEAAARKQELYLNHNLRQEDAVILKKAATNLSVAA